MAARHQEDRQIAEDLHLAGRRVHLAVESAPPDPVFAVIVAVTIACVRRARRP